MLLKRMFKVCLIFICGILLSACVNGLNSSYETPKNDNVEEDPIKFKDKVTKLTIVGDFLYEEHYYNAVKNGEDKNQYFSLVKDYFLNDDLSIGNMEVVIGNENLNVSGSGFSFCAPEYVGKQVIDLDMEVLSTSNNHSNDRGMEGRISTINYFKENSDILTVGTYLDTPRDVSKNVIEINDIKFGFLAYTYGTNVKVPQDLRYSLGLFKNPDGGGFTDEYKELLKNEISVLRENVDVLVVMMHWGTEFTYEPTTEQKNIAKFLNEQKVDIVIGTHSHSIQPIEWIQNDLHDTLVYYSLGNFVSADEDISRTGETFDNAYQFGLLSQLKVLKNNNGEIYISNIKAEPIVNYYDRNLRNFMLVPFDLYDETLEKTHYRYNNNFNKTFIMNAYEKVISDDFR